MRIVDDLEQNTSKWLDWRNQHICATDAAPIMGIDSFGRTPLKVWQQKISNKNDFKPTEKMLQGQMLEPYARKEFTKLTSIDVFPTVIESAEIPWAGASLDGLSYDKQTIVEIKVHSEDIFEKVEKGYVAPYIFAQINHQLMCSGLDFAYYFACTGHGASAITLRHYHLTKVYRDEEFIKKMFHAEQQFWECLQNLVAPAEAYGDYEIIEDEDMAEMMVRYLHAKDQKLFWENQEKSYKMDLAIRAQDKNVVCGLGKMTKVFRKGRILYNDIPELRIIDLETYRDKPSEYYLIKEI